MHKFMHYIKAKHSEHTINDDEATFYYEVDDHYVCNRSVEVFTDGTVLKYSQQNYSDNFGMLPDQLMEPMEEQDGIPEWNIDKEEFETAWSLTRNVPRSCT